MILLIWAAAGLAGTGSFDLTVPDPSSFGIRMATWIVYFPGSLKSYSRETSYSSFTLSRAPSCGSADYLFLIPDA
jgi:hypothetical protein